MPLQPKLLLVTLFGEATREGKPIVVDQRAPDGVVPRSHTAPPWPGRRPSLRECRSVRHRQATGKTPPDRNFQPSAEELRAHSETEALKSRRNPWQWRDRTLSVRPAGIFRFRSDQFAIQKPEDPVHPLTRSLREAAPDPGSRYDGEGQRGSKSPHPPTRVPRGCRG
jgi:hypothetical protein